MRSEENVRERFEELYQRRLQKKKEEFLSRRFRNCQFNGIHRVKGNGSAGFCHNPIVVSQTKQFMFVCNDDNTAKRCKCYECRNTNDSTVESFHNELRNPSICGFKYPKLAVLLWFLQEKQPMPVDEESRKKRFKLALASVWNFITLSWW